MGERRLYTADVVGSNPTGPTNFMIYFNADKNKEIKDNEILFIGCSHTLGAGHGVEDPGWPGPYDTVYTHIFAKSLNLKPLVSHHSARGNYFTEEKINTYNLKNKKVIIQFTDIFRLRLNGIDYDKDAPNAPDNIGYRYTFTMGQLETYSDVVFVSVFFEQVKRIVNLLRANNAKFLIFQLNHTNNYEKIINSHLIGQYKEFVYLYQGPEGDLLEQQGMPRSNIVDRGKDNLHYGLKSHENIALKLLEKWYELYGEQISN